MTVGHDSPGHRVQDRNIDWSYVYGWCDQHGTRDLLDEIRSSIPLSDPPQTKRANNSR